MKNGLLFLAGIGTSLGFWSSYSVGGVPAYLVFTAYACLAVAMAMVFLLWPTQKTQLQSDNSESRRETPGDTEAVEYIYPSDWEPVSAAVSAPADDEWRIWMMSPENASEVLSFLISMSEKVPEGTNLKILVTDSEAEKLAKLNFDDLNPAIFEKISEEQRSRYFIEYQAGLMHQIQLREPWKSSFRMAVLDLREKKFPFQKRFQAIACFHDTSRWSPAMKVNMLLRLGRVLDDGGTLFFPNGQDLPENSAFLTQLAPQLYVRKEKNKQISASRPHESRELSH